MNSVFRKLTFLKSSPKRKYHLSKSFIEEYSKKETNFGFNGLGETVYKRTYARIKENGDQEEWFETVERVVNGTLKIQKDWMKENRLPDLDYKKIGEEMYKKIFTMKFLPPGRGLWAMGTPIIDNRKLFSALNNCSFVSTENIDKEHSKPFIFLMDSAMLGVGVGFDTKGENKLSIKKPNQNDEFKYQIEDSREGWVKSVELLLNSYFNENENYISFDYSLIRKAGLPIKTFGGISSGPNPLIELHEKIRSILNEYIDRKLSVTGIVDLMNLIGKCVVSGNVRRTAEIAFGEETNEFLNLKDYSINPNRVDFGWTSNNSIFAKLGMNYENIAKKILINGEPGLAFLENMKNYSRMIDKPDYKDYRVTGGNPCLEQSLESYEMCCLVETFPDKHENFEEYLDTLKYAFLYAKTVTLGKTEWIESNSVMTRNRRIGTSMSGLAQFIEKRGLNELKKWCEIGYDKLKEFDKEISESFGINESIKITSIKPSGTVSLLNGSTPGMHYPEARYYIRRVRLSNKSELLDDLKKCGYKIEPASENPLNSVVVEFPIDIGEGIRTANEISIWEQLNLASFLQKYWSDNQVSCTVSFDRKKEGKDLVHALNYYQYQLKGISFLPKEENLNTYPQMPYERISKEIYEELISNLLPLHYHKIKTTKEDLDYLGSDKFCDSSKCEL
eukprot:gene1598-12723_t